LREYGKNKVTPNESAARLRDLFEKLYDVGSIVVECYARPLTHNLRALQDKEPFTRILSRLMEMSAGMVHAGTWGAQRPVLLNIARLPRNRGRCGGIVTETRP